MHTHISQQVDFFLLSLERPKEHADREKIYHLSDQLKGVLTIEQSVVKIPTEHFPFQRDFLKKHADHQVIIYPQKIIY